MSSSTSPEPRFAYPVVLDLHDVLVLVVGGGAVAAHKAAGLAAAGARVRLVATSVSDHVDATVLTELHERPVEDRDLDGVRLVVTATGVADVDGAVSSAARARGIWTNAADRPIDCDVILPAIARVGRLTVAVSTDGASPALARELRDVVADLLTDDLAVLAELLAAERLEIQAGGGSTEDVDWSERIRAVLDRTVPPPPHRAAALR